ncbi:MAG: thiamine diphosphokinase [Bacteroidetes bacterium]|nr:MAG: thiamine diphosphokinase [Bacteroidota bacterium]
MRLSLQRNEIIFLALRQISDMKALIIANGKLPPQRIVRALVREADYIVCADGGANHARRLAITPDIIVGDFDSITTATKRFYKNVPHYPIADQNSTDLEKAIRFCIERKMGEANIIGAFGERLDHTTGSLGCFKKFRGEIVLRFIDKEAVVSLIVKKITMQTTIGEKISLIPLDRCEGVTTKHLKYAVRNGVLELGVQEGTSNVALANSVTVSVKKGTLLLYRFHGLGGRWQV